MSRALQAVTVAVLAVAVPSSAATVPLAQQASLGAPNGAEHDFFGGAVALSGDTVAVGALGAHKGRGAVYVFTRAGTVWTRRAELGAPDPAVGDEFGRAVAFAGDSLVVGAPAAKGGRGAVYVFARSGSTWIAQQTLTAAGDGFGSALGGTTDALVVGASQTNDNRGAAYVFARSGSAWSSEQTLTASDGVGGDAFGASVAVSADAIAVGAPARQSSRGVVYAFARTGGRWAEEQELAPSSGADGDGFGTSVSISGDVLVGGAPVADHNLGAAFVFARGVAGWSEQRKLLGPDPLSGTHFGQVVAASGDAIAVAAPYRFNYEGVVYTFTGAGLGQRLTASDPSSTAYLGYSLALSGDALAAGAPLKGGRRGRVYMFARAVQAARVTVTLVGKTRTAGTFRISGAMSDHGSFSTSGGRIRLTGVHGTITLALGGGRWTITAGTGAYAQLRGAGTATTGTLRRTLVGTIG